MNPSYTDRIDKSLEDNYFHWEFNVRMKLARNGLLPQTIKPEFDQVTYRSTAE
ncbi:hypothetical protein PI124_g11657 [Phytophthora idaei]|nr:hypothetical protein PI125_g7533 [Phytophthora idaei]KAG3153867.1 hypothetical protein PI126_g9889 [Phytophthora idaei]KAG3243527.1 hypothetical protein PI124_g11657 [Phytophthora idaei]